MFKNFHPCCAYCFKWKHVYYVYVLDTEGKLKNGTSYQAIKDYRTFGGLGGLTLQYKQIRTGNDSKKLSCWFIILRNEMFRNLQQICSQIACMKSNKSGKFNKWKFKLTLVWYPKLVFSQKKLKVKWIKDLCKPSQRKKIGFNLNKIGKYRL